jgi:hypothetical protein
MTYNPSQLDLRRKLWHQNSFSMLSAESFYIQPYFHLNRSVLCHFGKSDEPNRESQANPARDVHVPTSINTTTCSNMDIKIHHDAVQGWRKN